MRAVLPNGGIMSFYSRPQNIHPGPIEGSAMTGLGHRAAINVVRVLDSCMKQISQNETVLHLSSLSAPPEDGPLKFVSAVSASKNGTVTDLNISRLEERQSFARVKCNVTIPLRVTFQDSACEKHTAESQITQAMDVVLYVPNASVFPFEVISVASCNCPVGRFTNHNTCIVTSCLTVILKIVADTDLLVPTYGFCPSPIATDFEAEACGDFFELPLYPSGR